MGNETINNIPNNFSECRTRIQCREFMKKNNTLEPLQYFELALTKIPDLLLQEQKIDLQDYIDDPETHYDPDFGRGWDIYCNILTVEQIQTVGY
jgi:hypothetical protein|tara:strand:- start:236 stop:517 length:282 start_codon:yes stop_codon:yes gene_type:complete